MAGKAPDCPSKPRLAVAPARECSPTEPQAFLRFQLPDHIGPETPEIIARRARPWSADDLVQAFLPILVDLVRARRPRHHPAALVSLAAKLPAVADPFSKHDERLEWICRERVDMSTEPVSGQCEEANRVAR